MVSVKTITERMIDKTSNTSRLIDKLMTKQYVTRIECPKDRRKVDISITEAGLNILLEASSLVENAVGHSLNAIIFFLKQ
jgi:DNA-binding MarR family transcriptional regulator